MRRTRSLLFAPASRPDVLAKLPRSTPDAVVLDLEDAVSPAGKADARIHALQFGESLTAENADLAVWVRVNALASEWFESDISEALNPGLAGVVVPKIESTNDLDQVRAALVQAGLAQLPVMAGLETALGVADARPILLGDVAMAYFGAEDFTADMGGVRTSSSREVLYARSHVALAARLAGVPVLDQVVADFKDDDLFKADAAEGRALGYSGKLCIHPGQVALAHEGFSPSADEIARAVAMLAAYDAAASRGEAAIAFEGQMVDEPLARRARAVIETADG